MLRIDSAHLARPEVGNPERPACECESSGIRDSESLDYLAAAAVDPDQLPGALRALI